MNHWKNILLITFLVWVGGVSCEVKEPEIPKPNLSVSEANVVTGFEYAALHGKVSCNFTIQDLILEYSKDPNLASATKVYSEYPNGEFHFVLDYLDIQTTYYYRYTVSNRINSVVDDQIRQFKTKDYAVPEVRTLTANSIQGTKAVLEARVNYSCGKDILNKGFLFGRKGEEMKPIPVTGEEFKLALTDLEMGTDYSFQAFAESEIGTGYGNTLSFTTCLPVSFSTVEVSEINATSALVTGGVLSDGGVPILEQGICYQAEGSDVVVTISYATSAILTDLTPFTQYSVWYYARTDDGWYESDHGSFKTESDIKFLMITVTDIKSTMAVVHGGIETDDGAGILEKGLRYRVGGTGNSQIMTAAYGEDITLQHLSPATLYEVWYYVKTNSGEIISYYHTFITASDQPGVLLEGVFSVAADKKVSFSRGVVRSNKGTKSISPYQYSMLGGENTEDNEQMDVTDMFHSSYGMTSLAGETWSVLSTSEWQYLLQERPQAAYRSCLNVTVSGVTGAFLVPDDWDISAYPINDGALSYQEFLEAQDMGAVFIPYTGYLYEKSNFVTTHIYMQDVGSCTVMLPCIQIIRSQGVNYNFSMGSSGEKSTESVSGAVRLVKVR